MIQAILVSNGHTQDNIFTESGRDSCNLPFIKLKDALKKCAIEIHTPDMCSGEPEIEIHLNVQNPVSTGYKYLILWEHEDIYPKNKIVPNYYRAIFSWKNLRRKNSFLLPCCNLDRPSGTKTFSEREIYFSMLASNNFLNTRNINELYIERARIINWFAKNHPMKFKLYGPNWNFKVRNLSIYGRLLRHFDRIFHVEDQLVKKIYCGYISSKFSILEDSKYSFCYENSRVDNYVTEKLIEAIIGGTVPIYIGPSNIGDFIPDECYINADKFNSLKSLYEFVMEITPNQYSQIQDSGQQWLKTNARNLFGIEQFVQVVVEQLVKDKNNGFI